MSPSPQGTRSAIPGDLAGPAPPFLVTQDFSIFKREQTHFLWASLVRGGETPRGPGVECASPGHIGEGLSSGSQVHSGRGLRGLGGGVLAPGLSLPYPASGWLGCRKVKICCSESIYKAPIVYQMCISPYREGLEDWLVGGSGGSG